MNERCRFSAFSLALTFALMTASVAAPLGADDDPDRAQTQLAFGVKMAKSGLWQEALFRFKQADRKTPGDSRTLNNIAVAYEALGLFDKALEVYQQAVKADPGNTELRQNYSRFVDFYRNFRPDPEDGEAAEETAAADADTSDGAEAAAEDGESDADPATASGMTGP